MIANNSIVGWVFIAYIGVMLAIGWVAYQRTQNLADYILGGRSLGPWSSALSASASDMSGWLLLGLPGAAYASGLSASNNTVLDLVSYAWAGFGGTFGPVLLLALFWKRATALGAMAGIVVGGVTVVAWANMSGGIFELYEIVPAFFLAGAAMIVLSLLSPEPSEEIQHEFDAVVEEARS